MKDISRKDTINCKEIFLPEDDFVKYQLDMMKDLWEELGPDHKFVHAGEAINSKTGMILLDA